MDGMRKLDSKQLLDDCLKDMTPEMKIKFLKMFTDPTSVASDKAMKYAKELLQKLEEEQKDKQ